MAEGQHKAAGQRSATGQHRGGATAAGSTAGTHGEFAINPDVVRARRNTVADLLSRSAARFPDKLALAFREERLTYAQLDTRVNQTAHRFLADGLKPGMRLAVLSKNSLDFAVVVFAAARVGVTIVPMNYMLTVPDIAYILGHCAADALAAPVEFVDKLEAAMAAVGAANDVAGGAKGPSVIARYLMQSSESMQTGKSVWQPMRGASVRGMPTFDPESEVYATDVAQILYTSGTESKPKGVMLTHDNLIAQYVSVIVGGRMESRDVCVHALPLYHSAQLNCFLGPSVYLGSTGIVLEQADPATILATVEREQVSQLFCPPTVWIALLRHPDFEKRDLSTLEKCYYGAAIMPMEVLKELSVRLPGAQFWNFYGQTEVAPLATALQPEDQLRKLGSAGQATLNVETRIVDDEDNEVPRGTVGEIVHRTAHAMLGYLNDPEKTAAAFQNGWFHSGDLGVMDEEGYITVVDRKKDMIKTGGINVSSREVEEAVYQYPGVSEVAVIGVPDEYWIEAVTAIVVAKPGVEIDVASLEAYCKENLAAFKVPKRIIVVEGLPRNPSGKILKRDLREQYKSLA